MSVHPDGQLQSNMTIVISCTVRYGAAPVTPPLSREQEPTVKLSLENGALTTALSAQVYKIEPTGTETLHQKTAVI